MMMTMLRINMMKIMREKNEYEEIVKSRLREEFPDRVIASYSVMPSPKVFSF